MDLGFGIYTVLFSVFPLLVFGLVIGIFAAVFFKGIGQWNKNNHSPRLTVPATVVSRRQHRTHGAGDHHHSHTSYHITFQFDSGDRLELQIPYSEFGYIVEGDKGSLTFQGSRFLSFERTT